MRRQLLSALFLLALAAPAVHAGGNTAPPSPRSYGLAWHQGYWQKGVNGGHVGWWWVVGGYAYLYPSIMHPYPDPYLSPAMALPASSLKPS